MNRKEILERLNQEEYERIENFRKKLAENDFIMSHDSAEILLVIAEEFLEQ